MPVCFFALALVLGWLVPGLARAQAPVGLPPWVLATQVGPYSADDNCNVQAVAADAAGNLFLTGSFGGTLRLGSLAVQSAGKSDFFLAKYVPRTRRWAWVVRGGGTDHDTGHALAVQGNAVYVTGYLRNNAANTCAVTLGTGPMLQQPGLAPSAIGNDWFTAKYLDHGTRAALAWCEVAGGTAMDYANGIAVRGPAVYVTGCLTNDRANSQRVRFGGSGPHARMRPQYGISANVHIDLAVAKYLDHGTYAALAWTHVAGGSERDEGTAVAVSGPNVYVAGFITNSRTDANGVRLGGSGRVPGTARQYGASPTSNSNWLLVKYRDLGDHAALGWSQVGGGRGGSYARSLAVVGRRVYVAGSLLNNAADARHMRFGGSGTRAGTFVARGAGPDTTANAVLAKYTDHGPTATLTWLQVSGGRNLALSTAVVARGRRVYLASEVFNNYANTSRLRVGGTGRRPGFVGVRGVGRRVNSNTVLAGYRDQGATAALSWVRVFDSADYAFASALALGGSRLYVAGQLDRPTRFGRFTLRTPPETYPSFLAALALAPTLGPVRAAGLAKPPPAKPRAPLATPRPRQRPSATP